MTDSPLPMTNKLRRCVLLYLLFSSAFFLYVVYGVWKAVPQEETSTPVDAAQFEGEGAADGTPELLALDPESATIGTGRMTVRILGKSFRANSKVMLDGSQRKHSFISQNELIVKLLASDFIEPGAIAVRVVNDDKTSNSMTLSIKSATTPVGAWRFLWWTFMISLEVRLILLVISIGAFGACVTALQSFADYRGQNKLTENWAIFYIVRPPVGAGVAFVFYLVIRGGFLSGTAADAGATTPFGIVAVSALAGMFADKAILKLSEVFQTLFKAKDDREGKLSAPLKFETADLPQGKVKADYKATLKAGGGDPPYKWSVASLPAGLTLDNSTGELSGQPQNAAKTSHKFTVTDSKGVSATITLELEVVQ